MKRPDFIKKYPEGYSIRVDHKIFLEKEHVIQFSPPEVVEQFAVECSE